MRKLVFVFCLAAAVAACKSEKTAPAAPAKTEAPAGQKTGETAKGKETAAPKAESTEKAILGTWTNAAADGFTAEFRPNGTGVTVSPAPLHRGEPTGEAVEVPFKWTMEGGKVKIVEGKKHVYTAEVKGDKLEVDFGGGAKTLFDRVKK